MGLPYSTVLDTMLDGLLYHWMGNCTTLDVAWYPKCSTIPTILDGPLICNPTASLLYRNPDWDVGTARCHASCSEPTSSPYHFIHSFPTNPIFIRTINLFHSTMFSYPGLSLVVVRLWLKTLEIDHMESIEALSAISRLRQRLRPRSRVLFQV